MSDIGIKINNLEIDINISKDLIEKVFKKLYSNCKIISKDNTEYEARGEAKKEMIREKMRQIIHKHDKQKVSTLLNRYGLSKLDDAVETMYDSIYSECSKLLDS